jgi:hypothetical protein
MHVQKYMKSSMARDLRSTRYSHARHRYNKVVLCALRERLLASQRRSPNLPTNPTSSTNNSSYIKSKNRQGNLFSPS